MTVSRKGRFPWLTLATALYFVAAAAFALRLASHELRTSALIDQIARRQDLNHVTNMDVNLDPRRMGVVTSFFLRISRKTFANRKAAAENQREVADGIGQLKDQIRLSIGDGMALVGVSLIFLFAGRALCARDPAWPQLNIYMLLAISLIFFAIGISCPVLTAVVKGQHMLIGGFIIQTASKGILSTVLSLFKSGNWMISGLLAAFSIGIPIFKGIAVLFTSLSHSTQKKARVGRMLETIGKWSLTDVLVAAVLLGCFSLNAVQEPDGGVYAVPRYALGFFIFYCALAARTSFLLRESAQWKTFSAPSGGRFALCAVVLLAGLAAGAAAGASARLDIPYWGQVADTAIVKLVRTQTEPRP